MRTYTPTDLRRMNFITLYENFSVTGIRTRCIEGSGCKAQASIITNAGNATIEVFWYTEQDAINLLQEVLSEL